MYKVLSYKCYQGHINTIFSLINHFYQFVHNVFISKKVKVWIAAFAQTINPAYHLCLISVVNNMPTVSIQTYYITHTPLTV